MNKQGETPINDVKDLRLNCKQTNSKNFSKKNLFFGYNVKETDNYISSIESNREIEKNALLDRIVELESIIKAINTKKDEFEASMNDKMNKLSHLEQENKKMETLLKQSEEKEKEYEIIIEVYEKKLQEREDTVVFIENTNLKHQLSAVINERNEYSGQLEIFKSENEYSRNKIEGLENEIKKLSDKLAFESEKSREQITELSLHATKIIDSNDFLSEKTIASLEDLINYNKNYKKEADLMAENLKKKLSLIYQ